MIKSWWFSHEYCGLALGYARSHQSRLSFVRCLLCKRDINVGSRGITTFMEHCRGLRHHRLDCLIRLFRDLPLRRRDGSLMSNEESVECRSSLGGAMVPFIETCPSFSVLEVFELEAAGRPVWGDEEEEDLLCEKTVHLFVCLVIDAIYRGCQFASVTSLWEVMVASEPQHASLFGVTCEVNDVMVIRISFCFFLFHEGSCRWKKNIHLVGSYP